MRLKYRNFLSYVIIAATVLACSPSRADDDPVGAAYPLISAYIYNFTQFTTWPNDADGDSFTVCVVGEDPFGSSLNPMSSRKVNGKKIIIRRYSRINNSISTCAVLFVANSESDDIKAILAPLKGKAVLTMSNIEGFSDKGGMVEFRLENDRIGIWINLPAVRAAGISISSKLLSLAHVKE